MKYSEETRNNDKIPYDNRPIIRQPANTTKRRAEKSAKAGLGLSLVVLVLIALNIILSAMVFTLIKKDSEVVNNQTINIETSGIIDVSAVASKCKPSVVRIHAGLPSGTSTSTTVDYSLFSRMKSKGSGGQAQWINKLIENIKKHEG